MCGPTWGDTQQQFATDSGALILLFRGLGPEGTPLEDLPEQQFDMLVGLFFWKQLQGWTSQVGLILHRAFSQEVLES